MKPEQLKKLNNLFNWIAELEKALDIKPEHTDDIFIDHEAKEIVADPEALVPLLLEIIAHLKAEFKELGYVDGTSHIIKNGRCVRGIPDCCGCRKHCKDVKAV